MAFLDFSSHSFKWRCNVLFGIPSNISPSKRWGLFSVGFIFTIILAFPASLYLVPLFYNLNPEFSLQTIICIILVGSVCAYIVSGIYSSKKSVAEFLTPIKGIKGKQIFLLIAVILTLGLVLGAVGISLILGTIPQTSSWMDLSFILPLQFLNAFFFMGGLTEEPGWRGFALPKLQKKYSPLICGLIIGIIWASWHLPAGILALSSPYTISTIEVDWNGLILSYIFGLFVEISASILFVWYYNKSQGNLLGCVLLHTSSNTFGYI